MKKDYKTASTDANINDKKFDEMKISEQTRQGTSGEVPLATLNVADVKGVIDAAVDAAITKAIEVSLFDNVKCKSSQRILLNKVVEMLRSDAGVKYKTECCRLAMQNDDAKGVEDCKLGIPCFGGAGIFDGRGHKQVNITELTGTTMCDVDNVDPELLEEMMERVQADEHTLLAYRSIRGRGLHILARYEYQPQVNSLAHALEEYTHVWETVNQYYAKLLGIESTDEKCKDASRMSFMAHDPKTFYNPNAVPFEIEVKPKRKPGRPRKIPTAAEAEKYVEQTLKQQGTVFKHGDRNDYVYKAASEMNQYGVTEDDCIAWAVEKYAEKDFTSEEITSTVSSAYTKVDEHGTKNFSAAVKKSQTRTATMQEIRSYLEEQNVQTRRNDITRKYEIYDERKKVWRELTDRDENDLEYRLGEIYDKHIPKNFLCDIINSSFSPEFNPILDYFESLEYDGTDYFEEVANRVHVKGCSQKFHNHSLKKFLIWAIAGWLDPKVVNHVAYILVGPQRSYKTNLLRSLLPPQFSELRGELSFKGYITKDDELELASMMFIELDEFDTLSNKENAQIRSLMTKDKVNKRAAYARNPENRLRIASFFGSTNNQNFLSDEYGNLRYMPFLIDYIDSPFDNPIDYDRFYGQLYHEYKSGFKYVLTKEEEEMLKVHNADFETVSMEEENIQIYFRVPSEGEAGEFFQVADVINHIRRSNPNLNLNPTRVRNILRKKYGYKKYSCHNGRSGAYLVPFTPEQRKANRKGDTAEPVDNRPMDASECINLELPF